MTYKAYKNGSNYQVYKETVRKYYSSHTFTPSSSLQTYTVPAGVTQIHVDCVAGSGFGADASHNGRGGRVQCDLSVTPGQTLYLAVGAANDGGGDGSLCAVATYNASDIRTNNAGITNTTSLQSRLVVAGGGGNAGTYAPAGNINGYGGNGGGLTGADGTGSSTYDQHGYGGTQSAGGAGGPAGGYGRAGNAGTLGMGGSEPGGDKYIFGAGGAGYYGGGSSGCFTYYSDVGSGGGGGSSYTDSAKCTNVTHTQGYRTGDGYITITGTNVYYEDVTTYKAFNV